VPVIPAIEVKSADGVDTILYFYDGDELISFYRSVVEPRRCSNPLLTMLTEEEIIVGGRNFRCAISAPDPFAPRLLGLGGVVNNGFVAKDILKHIDLIEASNGSMSEDVNNEAYAWAQQLKKPIIAGSDAHCVAHVGSVLTCAKVQVSQHFLDALLMEEALLVNNQVTSFAKVCSFVTGRLKILCSGWRGPARLYSELAVLIPTAHRCGDHLSSGEEAILNESSYI